MNECDGRGMKGRGSAFQGVGVGGEKQRKTPRTLSLAALTPTAAVTVTNAVLVLTTDRCGEALAAAGAARPAGKRERSPFLFFFSTATVGRVAAVCAIRKTSAGFKPMWRDVGNK